MAASLVKNLKQFKKTNPKKSDDEDIVNAATDICPPLNFNDQLWSNNRLNIIGEATEML